MWGQTLRTTFPIIPFTAATLAGGRWLPGVWPFRPPGQFCSPPVWASTIGGAGSRRVGHPGSWATPACFLHSSTLGIPVHVSVRTEKPARPSLAKGRSTQTLGAPTSPRRTPTLHTVPTPLPFQTPPCFCFSDEGTLGFQRESKSWYPALRTSGFGAGKLIEIADNQAQTPEE